jgi:hypothetical protein
MSSKQKRLIFIKDIYDTKKVKITQIDDFINNISQKMPPNETDDLQSCLKNNYLNIRMILSFISIVVSN